MDPIATAIIAALSAGAAKGLTDVAKKTVVDGYHSLKSLIHKKFGHNKKVTDSLDALQSNPESTGRRQVLAEELKAVNASADPELTSAAESLLALIKALPQGEQYTQLAQGDYIAQAINNSTATVSVGGVPKPKTQD